MTPNPNPIQSTMNTHHIVKQLKQLKLSAMAEGLDQYLLQAEQNSLDYTGFLSMLLEEELELRDQRKAERLLSGAQFGNLQCLEDFDVSLSTGLNPRSEEHTSELQSRGHLVCRLLLEKKKARTQSHI